MAPERRETRTVLDALIAGDTRVIVMPLDGLTLVVHDGSREAVEFIAAALTGGDSPEKLAGVGD